MHSPTRREMMRHQPRGRCSGRRVKRRPTHKTTSGGYRMVAIAILDDYQNVAFSLADWSRLRSQHQVTVFNHAFESQDAARTALAGFEVVCLMRERTPFPKSLIDALPESQADRHRGDAQCLRRHGSGQGARHHGLRHQQRQPRDGRTGDGPDRGPRPQPARRVRQHARGSLADNSRARPPRQDDRAWSGSAGWAGKWRGWRRRSA